MLGWDVIVIIIVQKRRLHKTNIVTTFTSRKLTGGACRISAGLYPKLLLGCAIGGYVLLQYLVLILSPPYDGEDTTLASGAEIADRVRCIKRYLRFQCIALLGPHECVLDSRHWEPLTERGRRRSPKNYRHQYQRRHHLLSLF